jgi:hypothetical protein
MQNQAIGSATAAEVIKPRYSLRSPVHVWAEVSPALAEPFKLDNGGGGAVQWGAVHVSAEYLDRLPLGAALGARAIPAGPLLAEVQGQQVLALARRQAARLQRSMLWQGRGMSEATAADAAADGAAAVVAWRNGQDMDGAERGAAGVCWRAVVRSVGQDTLGESIEGWRGQDGGADCWDNLTGSALPLPALLGDGSRAERAARLLFERARAKRPALLARRVEEIKAARGGRGKRAEVIDKLHRAAVLLLHGEPLDAAASAAGFKASGSGSHAARAGDRLMQAARRLGFRVRFSARDRDKAEASGAGGARVPMSAATAAALAFGFAPSATLPLQDGRGGKRRVAKLRRMARARARKARQAARRAGWAARVGKLADKRRDLARAARRADKAAGLWARFGAAAGAATSRTNGHWRGAARLWRG